MEKAQKRNLTGAAAIVMSSIIFSRITGYFRVMLIPNKLTEKVVADSYIMAFKVTDLMYNMLVGGAIAAALIPVLTGYIEKKQEEEGWKAVGTFINVVFIAMAFLCFLGIIFSPQIVPFIARGFDEEGIKLTVRLTRILFPSVSFIMLAGLTNGVLNSYHRFAAAAYGPVLYNLGGIFSLMFLSRFGVETVAFGVMCSSLLYFLFQLSFAMQNLRFYRLKIYMKHPGFRKLFKLAIPSMLSSSIVQVNVIISAMFVTLFKAPGSVNAFNMADTTWQMPYGIFAQGIGTAILPTLSARYAFGDLNDYKNILIKGLKSILLLSIPSAVGFIVLKEPIIRTIFQWSEEFDVDFIPLAGSILMFFSLALLTQSIVATVNRAFYAVNDTRSPLYVGASTIIVNITLSYVLYKYNFFGVAGMALSYSLTSTLNAILLLGILNRRVKGIYIDKLFTFLIKVIPASAVMGIVLYFTNQAVDFDMSSKAVQISYLAFEVIIGALIYFVISILLKVEEASYIYDTLIRKIQSFNRKIMILVQKVMFR